MHEAKWETANQRFLSNFFEEPVMVIFNSNRSMEHHPYSIRKILDAVLSGGIRIPAFQRGFVWDMELVAYLMDSIFQKLSVRVAIVLAYQNAALY
jgi:hypothetical protein